MSKKSTPKPASSPPRLLKPTRDASLHWFDVEELAAFLCGLMNDDHDYDADTSEVETALYDQYDIDFETFEKLVRVLLPLADVMTSELSGERYRCFAITKGNLGYAMCKMKYAPGGQNYEVQP